MDRRLYLAIVAAMGLAGVACQNMRGTSPDEGDTQSTEPAEPTGSESTTPSDPYGSGSGSESSTSSDPYGSASGSESTMGSSAGSTTAGGQGTQDEPGTGSTPGTLGSESDSGDMAGAMGQDPSGTASTMSSGSDLLGAQVVSSDGEQLGTVTQMVVDQAGTPAYVVISTQGQTAVVPYGTASAMVQEDKIVMDRARLEGAPKVQGELTAQTSDTWRTEADAYWGGGDIRTASPETGETTPPRR